MEIVQLVKYLPYKPDLWSSIHFWISTNLDSVDRLADLKYHREEDLNNNHSFLIVLEDSKGQHQFISRLGILTHFLVQKFFSLCLPLAETATELSEASLWLLACFVCIACVVLGH